MILRLPSHAMPTNVVIQEAVTFFSWEPALEMANSRDAGAGVQKKPLTKADGGDLLLVPVERPNELRLISARP